MNNIINFYYGINIVDVFEVNNMYYFNYNNKNYFLVQIDNNYSEINDIYNLVIELMKRNILTNEIITNKFNNYISLIDKKNYVLIKDNTKVNNITLNDILYIQNNTQNIICNKSLYRNNLVILWENKIDYYEREIKNIRGKYKLIDRTFDYFIGLSETALVYLINNEPNNVSYVLSHKRINVNKGAFDFYNPLNYIIDNRTRDFAEYTKYMYFNSDLSFELFINYLNYMNFNKDEYIFLISRLLFPSYYFDIVDNIIDKKIDDNSLERIINKQDNYINFIKDIMNYILIEKRINIPIIDYIIKK